MRQFLCTAFAVCGVALFATASQAKPEYARKENKPCAYCHVNPAGGGPRNPRGVFYGMHNHTFEGYDEAKVMGTAGAGAAGKKSGPPAFKAAWKIAVPAGTKRIAVADTAGDKKTRLLVLDDHNTLTINRVNGDSLEKEASVDLGEKASQFVVGQFAKGKPAIIAAPGAVYVKSGDTYVKKPASELDSITGFVRFSDGTENFFFFGGGQPDSYAIDPDKEKPLVGGRELVDPGQGGGVYADLNIHPDPALLSQLGVPEAGQKVGTVGLFDPRGEGKLYAWMPWVEGNDWTIHVLPGDALGPNGGGNAKPIWTSPKLAGKVVDVALGKDPKNPQQSGFFVLEATGDGGKERTVEFFALD